MRRITLAGLVACFAFFTIAGCKGPGSQPTPQPPPPPPPPANAAPQIRSLVASELRAEVDVPITLTVTERYTSGTTQAENKVSSTTTVRLNNSPRELREMSIRFLTDFANSKISPDQCVAEFSDSCNGKKDERADVDDNRHDYEHIASTIRHTSLSIAPNRMTAVVHTFCSFTVRVISTQPRDEVCEGGKKCPLGSTGSSTGDCWTNNVYERGRWWLCDSHMSSIPSLTAPSTFVPTLFRRSGR